MPSLYRHIHGVNWRRTNISFHILRQIHEGRYIGRTDVIYKVPSYTWWYFSFLPLYCHHIHDVFFDNWMSNTTTYLEYQLHNVTRYMMIFLHDARRLLRLSFLFPLFFHHICGGNTMRQQVMFHHVCGGIHVSFSSFPFLLKK